MYYYVAACILWSSTRVQSENCSSSSIINFIRFFFGNVAAEFNTIIELK